MGTATLHPRLASRPHRPRQNRDRELVDFVGRHGVVTIDHVMAALGVGRTAAYRRTSACIEARLLERFELLRLEPSLLRATRIGLRYAGLGLPPAVVSPGSLDHRLRSASTAQLLAQEFSPTSILTERDLILTERIEGKPIFSARLPGSPRLHRPDLAVRGDDRAIAIEVELTPKAPRRLAAIIRAWRRASWVSEVRYYCEPGPTRRGVERAVEKANASGRVHIFDAPQR
jgi:hypothetical protein